MSTVTGDGYHPQVRRRRRSVTVTLAAAAVAGATVFLALGLSAPAVAQPADEQPAGGGLVVTARTDDPAQPTLVLRNDGDAPCQVADTAFGTVALTRVVQDGVDVPPVAVGVNPAEAVDFVLASRLRVLAPGERLEIPLPAAPVGPTGLVLRSFAWAPGAPPVGALYPVAPDRPVTVELTYAVPEGVVSDGPPPCPAAAGATLAGPDEAGVTMWWLVAGAGVLVLAVGVAVVALLVRRRRRVTAAAAVVLLVATGLTVVDATVATRPAHADFLIDESLIDAYEQCAEIFAHQDGDPANIFDTLDEATVMILPVSPGDKSHHSRNPGGEHYVFWNPNPGEFRFADGNLSEPCSVLYHELYHAYEDHLGVLDDSDCVTATRRTSIPVREVHAVRYENMIRRMLGEPDRLTYGGEGVPTDECLPPEEQPPEEELLCSGRGCGVSDGDPHLVTFDGTRYDFQAVGEFVAAVDPEGGFQVQVRQEPWPNSRVVSVNTAVAFDVAGDRVEVRQDGGGLRVLVDGAPADSDVALPAGGTLRRLTVRHRDTVVVTWPDGSTASVTPIGSFGLRLWVQPAEPRAGRLAGLLGDFNGHPADDLRIRDGDRLPLPPRFDDLYPVFADSWRVDAATSLFTYAPGEGPDTYTDRSFPDRDVTMAELANRQWAEEICRRTGVREGPALEACTLDVALTGRSEFATSARDSATFLDVYRPEGPGALLRLDEPGAVEEITFDAAAGEAVFVDVGWTTLPNQCGGLRLVGPDDRTVETGCLIAGRGHLEARSLPADGRYAVRLSSSGTGEARVWVVKVRDQHGEVTVDGPPVTSVIDHPGAVSRFTFTGRAGQRIFVDATSTAPAQCAPLAVHDPDDRVLKDGCLIGGRGFVDMVTLPVDGVYTVEVDLIDRTVGTTTLRVIEARAVTGTVTVDGPAVTAVLDRPGSEAAYTFGGAAGQRVAVEVPATTLPSQCAPLQLYGPDGRLVALDCLIGSRGGIPPVTLPETGTYTVVVDPTGRTVGEITLRVVTPA